MARTQTTPEIDGTAASLTSGPWLLAVPVALVVLNRLHLTGHASLWYVLLVTGHVPIMQILGHTKRFGPGIAAMSSTTPEGSNAWFEVFFFSAALSAVAYGIGWGPVLIPCYTAIVATAISHGGSRRWKQALVGAVTGVVAGQVGIQLGWVYSYIHAPQAHAVAVLGTIFLIFMAATLAASAKRREEAERRLEALLHNGSDIVTLVDAEGTIMYQADSVRTVLGHDPSSLLATDLKLLAHPDDIAPALEAACGGQTSIEVRLAHADGSWRWCEARISNLLDDPMVGGVVLNIRDVTERRALEDQLRFQAFHDSLTGLANRALFGDRLDHALARQRRSGEPLAVLLIDLDDFKSVNDSLGHHIGDALLEEVARRLGGCTRATDTVARLGGDEFAILVEPWVATGERDKVSERVLAAFREDVHLAGRDLALTASIGIATAEPWVASADDILRNADVAMYAAKARGKGQAVRFEPGMHLAVQERFAMRRALHEAVAAGDQMRLHYQPVIDLETGDPVGVEALVRWEHPDRGLVPPLEFIPLAEELGLIIPIGRWVLSEACRQARIWKDSMPDESFTMSVNVSGRQLEDVSLIDDVRVALVESGLDPELLVLEITESVLMTDPVRIAGVLRELKSLGVRLAIDDFGTGYSSLGYLHDFPVDILKVDRTFVESLTGNREQANLAEAVVTIGKALRLTTIAEGVERGDQADRLRSLECELGQGYLFARPQTSDAITAWLRQFQVAGHATETVPAHR